MDTEFVVLGDSPADQFELMIRQAHMTKVDYGPIHYQDASLHYAKRSRRRYLANRSVTRQTPLPVQPNQTLVKPLLKVADFLYQAVGEFAYIQVEGWKAIALLVWKGIKRLARRLFQPNEQEKMANEQALETAGIIVWGLVIGVLFMGIFVAQVAVDTISSAKWGKCGMRL